MLRAAPCLIVLALLGGCQNGGERIAQTTGDCAPTCAGRPCATFANFGEARDAFTRQSKEQVILATLEDAAWLKFEV